ncbi:ATP-binding protein (plasmid) [Trichlorobacter lovleyi]|uniref:ATP-binding protein n=1 Tax=Trichlorobacter lovleyi TaxID=313985 RepID=UPI00223FD623|nr:ATP-binding protein [Trichlorobacter lovleyi]QOX81010.1 ATP-binding protein [Trichlorobacter lovleyi]
MYIKQRQLENLKNLLKPGKVVVIYGARRTGKTTLLNEYLKTEPGPYLLVSGEDIIIQGYLSSQSIEKLKAFVGNNRLLVIDEAQKVQNIGINLKLIVDHIPGIRVIATGSSSFDLARSIGEPLTGRKNTLIQYPLAQLELAAMEQRHETDSRLENRLIYGSYPEIVLLQDNREREQYLKEIVSSYLYKDILELEGIRQSAKIGRLLQLIAFQIGKEVSYSELGTSLGMSKNTADHYLDLLEKAFVLRKLGGFSRNLRNEVTKNSRYYFVDNGVRNALINNFNPLELRNDPGELWENYLVMERLKRQEYLRETANNYFWRTYTKKELDLVEERDGKLHGYEIKWGKARPGAPKEWTMGYPEATWNLISRDNYLTFVA